MDSICVHTVTKIINEEHYNTGGGSHVGISVISSDFQTKPCTARTVILSSEATRRKYRAVGRTEHTESFTSSWPYLEKSKCHSRLDCERSPRRVGCKYMVYWVSPLGKKEKSQAVHTPIVKARVRNWCAVGSNFDPPLFPPGDREPGPANT